MLTIDQLTLERMDEMFGVTDFSGVEDVGKAATHGKLDIEAVHVEDQPVRVQDK